MKKRSIRQLSGLLLGCLLFIFASHSCSPQTNDMSAGKASEEPHEHPEIHPEERGILDELILTGAMVTSAGIETAAVRLMSAPGYLETTGLISPVQSRIAHIRPLAQGIVEEVTVGPGDFVKEGQLLLRYDNIELGELLAHYGSARTSLVQARSQEKIARELRDRGKELLQAEAISENGYKAREAKYFQTVQAVASLEGELKAIEGKLRRYGVEGSQSLDPELNRNDQKLSSTTNLRAPFNGTVIDFEVSRGEVVDPARIVMTVADLASVWVMIDIYEKDLQFVRPGLPAFIRVDSYPDEVFTGEIRYIGDFVDPHTRTVKARCEVLNRSRLLKLGMFANAQIQLAGSREIPAVPQAALQQIDEEDVVFVELSPGHFKKRTVEIGLEVDGWVTIEQGLTAGETIVTEGSFALKSELLREQLGGGHAH